MTKIHELLGVGMDEEFRVYDKNLRFLQVEWFTGVKLKQTSGYGHLLRIWLS